MKCSTLKFQSYADEIQGTITLVIDTIQKSKQSTNSIILYLLPHDKHTFLVYSEVQSSFGFSAPTDIHQNEQKTGFALGVMWCSDRRTFFFAARPRLTD